MMKKKFFSRIVLSKVLKRHRKEKIVFANGCFDILHAGHVELLEKARSFGDRLVVAINSDRSLKKLKDPGRPLVEERHRAKVLSSLSCVDYVTVFPEQTPYETIQLLKPSILVKGADYPLNKIVGRDLVKTVKRIKLVKNLSTTNLIKKIVKRYG